MSKSIMNAPTLNQRPLPKGLPQTMLNRLGSVENDELPKGLAPQPDFSGFPHVARADRLQLKKDRRQTTSNYVFIEVFRNLLDDSLWKKTCCESGNEFTAFYSANPQNEP
jgi:hypothetical protein